MNTLLSFGHDYSAQALSRLLISLGWRVNGTTRSPDKEVWLAAMRVEPLLWPGDISSALDQAAHLLTSVAPDSEGDQVLRALAPQIAATGLNWVGYPSTTAVYGHHNGDWVDEDTALTPTTARCRAGAGRSGLSGAGPAPAHLSPRQVQRAGARAVRKGPRRHRPARPETRTGVFVRPCRGYRLGAASVSVTAQSRPHP